jgi:PAS domain S-box-containing protein
MLFSFVDVEPRRKAEVALRQSEERFAKAFGLTPVPILVCSASDQVVMDVNEAFLESLAYPRDEVQGKPSPTSTSSTTRARGQTVQRPGENRTSGSG